MSGIKIYRNDLIELIKSLCQWDSFYKEFTKNQDNQNKLFNLIKKIQQQQVQLDSINEDMYSFNFNNNLYNQKILTLYNNNKDYMHMLSKTIDEFKYDLSKQVIRRKLNELEQEIDEDTDKRIFTRSCKNANKFISMCDFSKITIFDDLPFVTFDSIGQIVFDWKRKYNYKIIMIHFKNNDKISISSITNNNSTDLFSGNLEDAIYKLEKM